MAYLFAGYTRSGRPTTIHEETASQVLSGDVEDQYLGCLPEYEVQIVPQPQPLAPASPPGSPPAFPVFPPGYPLPQTLPQQQEEEQVEIIVISDDEVPNVLIYK